MATTITGALGADTITGIVGADTLEGGLGNDLYVVRSLLNVIIEPAQPTGGVNYASASYGGVDTIQTSVLDSLKTYSLEKSLYVENLTYTGTVAAQLKGNANNNIIKASATAVVNDTLYGADGNDSLYGYAGKDLLQGGRGDDVLAGGIGSDADTLIGGTGNDSYFNVTWSDVVIEVVDSGFDTIFTGASGGKYLDLRTGSLASIEGLVYNSSLNGVLHGNAASNAITSMTSTGNDTLSGWDGNDSLYGGGGNDSLNGGTGDDELTGGAGTDTLVGGSGNDIYFADSLDMVTESAGAGIDTLVGTKTSLATTAYATTIENLIYTGTAAANVLGNALDNTLGGGSAGDTLTGGSGDDKLIGGAGRDSLLGGVGDDVLYGGSFGTLPVKQWLPMENLHVAAVNDGVADTLVGGSGSDTYFIDSALDVIMEVASDTGADVIRSGIDLSLTAYSNIEVLVLDDVLSAPSPWLAEGNASANVIIGNNSENYISGGAGNDTLTGDAVDWDFLNFQVPITDVVDGGDGNDVLMALTQPSWFYGEQSGVNTVLMGGAGHDFYLLKNENTSIDDSLGTDTVYLMTSASLEGAEGVERIVLAGGSAAHDAIAIAALNQVNLFKGGATPDITSTLAVNARGNALDNLIYGNNNDNVLEGLAGNDSMKGGNGNDTLIGGAGVDTLEGGNGNDLYDINAGDVVTETATGGIDLIRSATLTSYAGYANIEGFEYTGTNSVLLQNGTSNSSAETLISGAGNDTLNGWGGNDSLSSGAGNDSINGGDGDDLLQGGAGADTITGGLGNDTINGFASWYEMVDLLDLKNTLYGGAGNDQMTGGNAADLMNGDEGNDTLYGGQGADTLNGGAGQDWLEADSSYSGDPDTGNVLNGDAGNDWLEGAEGNDTLSGGSEDDYLSGYNGNDFLNGGTGNDDLSGNAGNDFLNGGTGNDSLVGGEGADILYAGGATPATSAYNTGGDQLVGDDSYDSSLTDQDIFRFEATAAFASLSIVTGDTWNGTEYVETRENIFNTGHFIDDFTVAEDKIQFARAMVGDGDTLLESVAVKTAAGGTFAKAAEMVIVRADVATDFGDTYGGGYWSGIHGSEVAGAIGRADTAFAIGDKRLFVVDDGISSAVFQFVSAGADTTVSEAELKLVGVVDGQAGLSSSDFGLY